MATGFVTRSSNASLPVATRAAERMGVNEGVHGFTLPLGASMNSDGSVLYVGASLIFVANVAGVELTVPKLIGALVIGVLSAFGTAGVPSGSLVKLTVVVTQAGLPLAPVALVAGIDAILDMARTMSNVLGDLVGTRIVAQTEPGMLEEPTVASQQPDEHRAGA